MVSVMCVSSRYLSQLQGHRNQVTFYFRLFLISDHVLISGPLNEGRLG